MTFFDPNRMLAFDLETTGKNPRECRIVTSALVRLADGSKDSTLYLADPGVEIPQEATNVHGITTEMARTKGRPHDEVLADTITGLRKAWQDGLTVVAYNAAYDLTVLMSQDPSFTIDGLVLDPFVIDKKYVRRKGPRKLEDAAAYYHVRLDSAHDATEDALAAARIAWMQAKQWPELTQMPADELMEFQAIAYFEQKQSLKAYLEGIGKDTSDINFGWPTDTSS